MSTEIITDPFLDALDARLLGASKFDSGFKILDDILNLQFRLYYNIATNNPQSTNNNNKLDILLKECMTLQLRCDQSIQLSTLANNKYYLNLILNTLQNCKAIVQYYKGSKSDALHLFNECKYEYPGKHDFELLLQLEAVYYDLLLNQPNDDQIVLKKLSKVVRTIPLNIMSKGYIFDYLKMISKLLNLSISKLQAMSSSSSQLHGFLFFILNDNIKKEDLLTFNKILFEYTESKNITEIKFPKATQSNNNLLEQFNLILQLHFQKFTAHTTSTVNIISTWKPFIISIMGRTFQSHIVSKTAMLFFHLVNEDIESLLNFKNIIKYTDQLTQLNKPFDGMSLIDSYNYALTMKIKTPSSYGLDRDNIAESLFNHLSKFYQDHKLKLFTNNKESLNFISNNTRIILPNQISRIFAQSWAILYNLNCNKLESLQSNQLISYLCNAMSLFPNNKSELLQLYYKYAYTLTLKRQIDMAITFLQSFILNDNPFFYKAWHLLALCKSIKENKQDSYKIICSVLEALQSEEDEDGNEIKWDKERAWETVNFKITQLYLIDEIFGTAESIEMLSDLFELYHTVYDGRLNSSDAGAIRKQNTQLQQLWLLSAELYMKLYEETKQVDANGDALNLLKEAREALAEAKAINKSDLTNINCNILKGYYYILERNPIKALSEFEEALYFDNTNVDAIVAYSQLIFSYEEMEDGKQRDSIEDFLPLLQARIIADVENDLPLPELFINKGDKSAALASVKLLLERSIVNSIDAFYSADVWWYLSLIYEKYQDREYQDALLTCIRNKETTPIRPFHFL